MKIKDYLPSKNFIIALFSAIIIVVITIVLNFKKSEEIKYNNLGFVSGNSTSSDWLVELQNATTTEADWAYQRKYEEELSKLNNTQKLARSLLSDIVVSQPVSGQMSNDSVEAITDKFINSLPQKDFADLTKISELTFVEINSANLTIYKSNYYLESEKIRKNLGKDLEVIFTALNNKTIIKNVDLEKIQTFYKISVANFKKMDLPAKQDSAGVEYHLAVINNLEKITVLIDDIINVKSDVALIYSDILTYNDVMADLISRFETIDYFLKIKRV